MVEQPRERGHDGLRPRIGKGAVDEVVQHVDDDQRFHDASSFEVLDLKAKTNLGRSYQDGGRRRQALLLPLTPGSGTVVAPVRS